MQAKSNIDSLESSVFELLGYDYKEKKVQRITLFLSCYDTKYVKYSIREYFTNSLLEYNYKKKKVFRITLF